MKIEILRLKLKENIVFIQSNLIYIYKVGIRLIVDEVIIFDDMIKEVFLEIKVEDNGNKFNVYFMVVYFYKQVKILIVEIMCIGGVLCVIYIIFVYCFVSINGINYKGYDNGKG